MIELAIGGFILTLLGFAFGVWKYIDSKLTQQRVDNMASVAAASAKADLAIAQLAEHKLHAAETFATKAGMQEQTNQMLRAIEGVASRIDALNERLDRAFEVRSARRSS